MNKNKKGIIFEMTIEEILNNPFMTANELPFYRFFGDRLCGGFDKNVQSLDCRKIIVSDAIMDKWYESVEETKACSKTFLTQMLLLSGPKSDSKLKDNQVLLQEGWVELKDASVIQAS